MTEVEVNAEVKRLLYNGDLGELNEQIFDVIGTLQGKSASIYVDIKDESIQDNNSVGHLSAFRRLVRLSPHLMVCNIEVGKITCLQLLMALVCDVVHSVHKDILVTRETQDDPLYGIARKHWRFYTRRPAPVEEAWSFGNLTFDVPVWTQAHLLPHYLMGLRNAGMATTVGVQNQEDKNVRLVDVFDYYNGCKVASLFALWDAVGKPVSNPKQMTPDINEVVTCYKSTLDEACIKLTSDMVYATIEEIVGKCKIVQDSMVRRVNIVLLDGKICSESNVFPLLTKTHMDMYKWHRKWEQFLGTLVTKHLTCTVVGKSICGPLMEMFFVSSVRIWANGSDTVTWCKLPMAYCPGPESLQGALGKIPVAALRKFMLTGLPVEEAEGLGLVMIQGQDSIKTRTSGAWKDTPVAGPVAYHLWEWGGGQLGLPKQQARPSAPPGSCSLLGYGLAIPGEEHTHTQAQIAELLGVPLESKYGSIFTKPHIKTRCLAEMKRDLSDPASVDLTRLQEKHLHWAKRMLREAIKTACDDAGIEPKQISHASIVSSSGYLLPGLTAYIVQDPTLGIPQNISRQDIVGMGCHAGLNSYKSAAMYAVAHPGQYALCCGVEVLSAQYIWGAESKEKLGTTVVNSLFADGCFAGILRSTPTEPPNNSYFDAPPTWWEQCCDTVALPDMIYRVERGEEKYRFDLSELAPYHVGQGLRVMMHDAMWGGIPVHYAEHVITHTGGKTVLDCTVSALGLEGGPKESLQPTCKALREYGNQSSCSFFFAFDNLVKSGTVCAGDLGIFVTMGPGAGLEMALFTAGKRFTESATRVQVAPPNEGC